jgi:hypothetical protein
MKLSKFSTALIFGLAIVLATSAFAADTHKASFQISESVQVSGTELAAGDYVAKWSGDGPDVQLNITRNGKSVATVPAKLVQLDRKAAADAAEIRNGSGGGRELGNLQFAGKKYSIELGAASSSTASVK